MLPPRLGLLSYAADVYLSGRVDDILLLPVSITFDQLHEISEYADYARGGSKKPEGFGWLYGFIKAQGARHYGKIYVRFGEPVSLSSFLGPVGGSVAADPAARRLALQKTAFEVAWRINQGMPVHRDGPGHHRAAGHAGGRADVSARSGWGWPTRWTTWRVVRCRGRRALGRCPAPLGVSGASGSSGAGAVRATLDALVAGGVVSFVAEGARPGVADRARAAARGDLLPELADPLPARYGAVRAGRVCGRVMLARTRWGRSGTRSPGCVTC